MSRVVQQQTEVSTIGYLFGWGGSSTNSGSSSTSRATARVSVNGPDAQQPSKRTREQEMVARGGRGDDHADAAGNAAGEDVSNQNPLHATKRRSSFLDLSTLQTIADAEDAPEGVQILNMMTEESGTGSIGSNKPKFVRTPTSTEVDIWVDDLVALFSEAVAKRRSLVGALSTKYTKGAAAETFSFKQAQTLATKLIKVDAEELFDRADKTVIMKLNNALCLHASIEMRCSMRDVVDNYADNVAYNIGGKVLTINSLNLALK